MALYKLPWLTILRAIIVIGLGLLTCAWIISLSVVLLPKTSTTRVHIVGPLLMEELPAPPTATDTLVIRASASDIGVQQRYAYVVWSQQQPQGYARRYTIAFLILADGQTHQYIVPVGIHPEWRGTIHTVNLVLPQHVHMPISNIDVYFVKRPPGALDALLGRLLAPYLAVLPPWPYLVLWIGAILSGGLAITWPTSCWRTRLGIAGLAIGGVTGLIVVASLMSATKMLSLAYGSLDEGATSVQVPAYNMPAQMNQALVAASNQLPYGRILVNDTNPNSYLIQRARYLLYPRPIVIGSGFASAAVLRQQLADGYVGLVDGRLMRQAPFLDWQRIGDPIIAPAIWRAPHLPSATPPSPAGRWAIAGLLGGLGLVLVIGWCTAGYIGALGWARVIYAWPFGMSLTAWWMFILSLLSIPWSWWSIGLPLAIGAGLLCRFSRAHAPAISHVTPTPRSRVGWKYCGLVVMLVLIGCVAVQALLLPFTDIDSWLTWGFRSRSFYLDGNIGPVLRLYQDTRHPPAQSLIQAWGYLTMGGISERLVKVIFPLWYATGLGIVWLACRHWNSGPLAMMWTLLVATTPILLDHATLGNADLPLAVGLLIGGYMLCEWVETGIRSQLLGGVLGLAGAAWIKFDGPLLGAVLLIAAVLARSISLYRDKQRVGSTLRVGFAAFAALLTLSIPWQLYAWWITHYPESAGQLFVALLGIALLGVIISACSMALHRGKQRLRLAILVSVIALCVIFAFILPWIMYVRTLELRTHMSGLVGDLSQRLNMTTRGLSIWSEELLFSHSNSTWSLLGSGYGALWLVCGGALVLGWRRLKSDAVLWFLLLAISGCLGLYLAFYTLMPADLIGDYFYSTERYLLHIAPLAVLAAARATRPMEQTA